MTYSDDEYECLRPYHILTLISFSHKEKLEISNVGSLSLISSTVMVNSCSTLFRILSEK